MYSSATLETPLLFGVVSVDPASNARWDKFVINHPLGAICHLSGWRRVLETSFPHLKGHYLALTDGINHGIKAGLPVFEVNSWITGKRLVSIPFATLCDPLISNDEELSILLAAAKALARKISASHIEIRTMASPYLIENNAELGVVEKFKQHYILLDGNPESLLRSFHKTCVRKHIKKMGRKGLSLRISEDAEDLQYFYSLYAGTRKSRGLPALPFHFVKAIFSEFLPDKRVVLLVAEYESRILAGMVLFKFKDRVSAEFLGWDRDYADLQLSVYIYWEAIKMALKGGYKIFDFGRTDVNNHGLMDFKSHWGTQVKGLPQFYYPIEYAQSALSRNGTSLRKLAGRVFGNAPGALYLHLGNFCYRHLS